MDRVVECIDRFLENKWKDRPSKTELKTTNESTTRKENDVKVEVKEESNEVNAKQVIQQSNKMEENSEMKLQVEEQSRKTEEIEENNNKIDEIKEERKNQSTKIDQIEEQNQKAKETIQTEEETKKIEEIEENNNKMNESKEQNKTSENEEKVVDETLESNQVEEGEEEEASGEDGYESASGEEIDFPDESFPTFENAEKGEGTQVELGFLSVEPTNQKSEEVVVSVPDLPEDRPLPENWERAYDENRNVYYYNSMTGESTWERPVVTPVLPEGWSQAQDDQGNVYYYNIQTQEAKWEFPSAPSVPQSSSSSQPQVITYQHGLLC